MPVLDAPKPVATPSPNPAPAPAKPSSNPDPTHLPNSDPQPGVAEADNEFFVMEEKMGKAPAKEAPATPPETANDTSDEPADKAKDEPKKDEKKPAPIKPEIKAKSEGGALREKLETATRESEGLRKEVTDLKAKLSEVKPAEELTAITQRLAAVEKERDGFRSEIAMLKQEATPEFKSKWEEPFNREYKRATKLIAQIPVTENGQQRAGTQNDLNAIYGLPFAAAAEKARELFGDYAGNVMTHYTNLHGMDDDYKEALEGERKTWKETSEKRLADETKHREGWFAAVTTAKEQLQKNPKFAPHFAYDENDAGAKGLVEKGQRLWATIPPEPDKQAMRMASIELAVTHYPRIVSERNQLRTERDALAAKLKEYEASEPGPTKRKTTDAKVETDDEAEDRRRFIATR